MEKTNRKLSGSDAAVSSVLLNFKTVSNNVKRGQIFKSIRKRLDTVSIQLMISMGCH